MHHREHCGRIAADLAVALKTLFNDVPELSPDSMLPVDRLAAVGHMKGTLFEQLFRSDKGFVLAYGRKIACFDVQVL